MESISTTPVPDPTLLTTQQLLRENSWLKEIVFTRLDGMQKAVDLLQSSANRSPTINEVYLQHEEKFNSIKTQFTERDTRTEQTSRDSKVAVDAALQAAKEAVGEQNKSSANAIAKSEAATTKQIDAIGVLIQTNNKATDDKIDDLKTRMTLNEGRSKGIGDSWAGILGVAGFLVALGALVILFVRK